MTQNDRVLQALKDRPQGLTVKEAMTDLGVGDLRKRINELRDKGFPIADEWETALNRHGDVCRFKRFYLGKAN